MMNDVIMGESCFFFTVSNVYGGWQTSKDYRLESLVGLV